MIPVVVGVLGTLTKELVNGLEDLEIGARVKTIPTTALLISDRILRRFLETCGDSSSSGRSSTNVGAESSPRRKNNPYEIIIASRKRSNSNKLQSYGIKHSYLIVIILKQMYLINRWTLTGSTTPNQSGYGSNGHKRVLHRLGRKEY